MGTNCWMPSTPKRHSPGCRRFLRWRPSGGCGCRISSTIRTGTPIGERLRRAYLGRGTSWAPRSTPTAVAKLARKFTTSWIGYRVHLTETCDDDLPSIITDVRTAPAPVADGDATPLIHEALAQKEL